MIYKGFTEAEAPKWYSRSEVERYSLFRIRECEKIASIFAARIHNMLGKLGRGQESIWDWKKARW